MKRVLIVALVVLWANTAWADEPREIPMTGNIAADTAFSIVNAMNRQMKMIEDESNLVVKSAEYYKQLMDMEQQLQAEKKKLSELDKQLQTQERDLKANYDREKAGKSDADRDKLADIYEQRKKELADARKQVNGLPAMMKTLGSHIGAQAKILKQVKSMEDWVDPKTGRGRLRAQFQLRRNKINDLTNKVAGTTTRVKAIIEKGSDLDFKGEKVGKWEVLVSDLSSGTPAFEWTANGAAIKKGGEITVGDDRVIRLQVKLVEDRRKQSRTIKDGSFAKKNVAKVDYDFEYGIDDRSFSRWVIDSEEYSDWRVEGRAREPGAKSSSSGVFAAVKGDVMTITFSPDTAADQIHVSVIGRLEWKMTGKRAGNPTLDGADASGNASLTIKISPAK